MVSASADSVARTSARPCSTNARSSRSAAVRRRGGQRVQALLRRDDQVVIALQVPARVGELLAVREQPLRQHFPARQRALQHAPAERLLLEPRDLLEGAGILQPEVGVELQQSGDGHRAVDRLQQPFADLPLQFAARHADQARRARKRQPLRHPSSAPRGPRSSVHHARRRRHGQPPPGRGTQAVPDARSGVPAPFRTRTRASSRHQGRLPPAASSSVSIVVSGCRTMVMNWPMPSSGQPSAVR